jgi:ribosomal-protein-serine acetyltransferase
MAVRLQVNQEIELRAVTESEYEAVFNAVDQSRTHLREWLPWVDAAEYAEDYINVIRFWQQDLDNGIGMSLGIYYKTQYIGMCGFNTIDNNSRRGQIGYWISQEFEGKGIVRECVKCLVEYAFNQMGLNRIEIICGVENQRSRKLPETLGFTAESTMKEYEFLYDHFHDCVMYRLLKREYE